MKKKAPKYIWYLPLVHILFPLFFLFESFFNPGELGINRAVAYISGITSFFLLIFCYSSFIALKVYKKLNQKTAWIVFAFTVVFPWIFVWLITRIEGSTVAGLALLPWILFLIIWIIPFTFIFMKKFLKK